MENHKEQGKHAEVEKNHSALTQKTKEHTAQFSNSFHTKIYLALIIALVIFTLINVAQSTTINKTIKEKLSEAKEAARPAELQLIIIDNSECNDCFDILPIINKIKSKNVNITIEKSLDLSSLEANSLIKQYDINKIPTIILLGELDKTKLGELEKKEDALIFTKVLPPYTNAKTKKIAGLVTATIIQDNSCKECSDLNPIIQLLKQDSITIISENIIDKSKGKELIEKYYINILPTIILSKDLEEYDGELVNNMNNIGTIEKDGSYVLRKVSPPYLNLTTNKVHGLVDSTYLLDKTCQDCFDVVAFNNPILERLGLTPVNEEIIDISSPKAISLLEKYNITKVPTLILKGDIKEYPALVRSWSEVGSVETDGNYVFRRPEVSGAKYKNLVTNEIIEP